MLLVPFGDNINLITGIKKPEALPLPVFFCIVWLRNYSARFLVRN